MSAPTLERPAGTEAQASSGRGSLSVADDSLDKLIEAASAPTLADLIRRGKKKGMIGAVSNYGGAGTGA